LPLKVPDSDAQPAAAGHLMNDPFSLGDWRVDPALKQIVRGAEVVRVDPRNMRVLQVLASRAGQVVSQAEIEKIAWSGLAVTPDSVYQSVAQLRRALGEDKAARRYIETVPRKGYRLIVPVSREPPALVVAENTPQPPPALRSAQRKPLVWGASIAFAAVAAAGVLAWLVRSGEEASGDIAEVTQSPPVAVQTNPKTVVKSARTELPQSYQGDSTFRQAIAYLEAQLKTQSETAGADDPALVTILSRLANIYPLVSDPRKCELAARRGLAILEKIGGTRSTEGIELHATLGEALADLERYEDAESQLQTALQLARELHGDVHEATVDALDQLALLRIAQRRFEEAEQQARRALQTHRRLPEPGTARAALLASRVAWALIEQGRATEAIRQMDEALGAIKPDDPPAPYLVALAHHFRGEALNRAGRPAEAELALRAELDLFAKIPHVRMDEGRAMTALAEAHLMQGAVAQAAKLLSEARTLLKDGDGWRERKARHENELLIQQLRKLEARTAD
jgi:DNA-binding winged helix-turn-helix (wHTH) protein/Flp pilus assembly protein TadD